jgi:hypothetical protein
MMMMMSTTKQISAFPIPLYLSKLLLARLQEASKKPSSSSARLVARKKT